MFIETFGQSNEKGILHGTCPSLAQIPLPEEEDC